MKIPQEKSFLTLPAPSVLKIIEIKNDINFYCRTSFCYFPCYSELERQVLKLCFCQTYAISVSLTIEIHKNRTRSIKTKLIYCLTSLIYFQTLILEYLSLL